MEPSMARGRMGVGLELSASRLRLACGGAQEGAAELVRIGLPVFYTYGEGKEVLPGGMAEWLSERKLEFHSFYGFLDQVSTTAVMGEALNLALDTGEKALGEGIKTVCTAVSPSLSQNQRATLRGFLEGKGVAAQLLNEDQAVLKACPDLRRAESLLIFNLHGKNSEILWYRSEGRTLKLNTLEVFDECGTDVLDFRLLSAAADGIGVRQFRMNVIPTMLSWARSTRMGWRKGSTFVIEPMARLGGVKGELSAERTESIYEKTFGALFEKAGTIVPLDSPDPLVAVVCNGELDPYLSSRFEHLMGWEVRSIDRKMILNGAAITAHEASGSPEIPDFNTEATPIELRHPIEKRFAGPQSQDQLHLNRTSSRGSEIQGLSNKTVAEGVKRQLAALLTALDALPHETLGALVPVIQQTAASFQVEVVGLWARKLIEIQRYEDALGVYKKYWDPNSNMNALSAPAADLCMKQLRHAKRRGDLRKADEWGYRGVYFDRKNRELREHAVNHCICGARQAVSMNKPDLVREWCYSGQEIEPKNVVIKDLLNTYSR